MPVGLVPVFFAAGGDVLTKYGTLVKRTFPADRGGEQLKETFARTGGAVARSRSGVGVTYGANAARCEWTLDPVTGLVQPYLPLEAARTQLVTDPENFGNWTNSGTPINVAGGQTDPFGGTAAYTLEDDNAAGEEGKLQTVSFTGDGEKCISVSFKAGTAPRLHLGLWDNTAAAWRHRAHTIYTAGVPGALAEGTGTGTLFPVENWGGVWYRFSISATGVIAANTNQMFLRVEQPANLGTWFMFGANAWNASFPSSYQGPSLGTRNADLCTVPWYVAPQAGLWRYHRFLERGTVSLAAGPRIGNIGGNGAIKWELLGDGAAHYRSALTNNVDPVNASVAAVTPTYGQLVETLELLTTGGNLKLLVSVNGAADVAGAQSGAFPAGLAAQWSAAIAAIGSDAVGNPGYGAFSRVLVGLGAGTLVSTIADARAIPV